MNQKEIYNKLMLFIRQCIDDDSVTIIRSDQISPRPKKPFITISIYSTRPECNVIRSTSQSQNLENIKYIMNSNVKIQSFCDEADYFQAINFLEKIRIGFDLQLYERFEGKITHIRDLTEIIFLPTEMMGTKEYRAVYEFLIRYNVDILTYINSIKSIQIIDEVNNDEIIVEKNF
jgi:hypothetical protein